MTKTRQSIVTTNDKQWVRHGRGIKYFIKKSLIKSKHTFTPEMSKVKFSTKSNLNVRKLTSPILWLLQVLLELWGVQTLHILRNRTKLQRFGWFVLRGVQTLHIWGNRMKLLGFGWIVLRGVQTLHIWGNRMIFFRI